MSSKQMVNVSEGICFRLRNVVSSQRQSEQTGLLISLDWRWQNFSINLLNVLIMSKSYTETLNCVHSYLSIASDASLRIDAVFSSDIVSKEL